MLNAQENDTIIENIFDGLDIRQSLEKPDFKNITKLAKSIFDIPVALITIIEENYLYVSESKEFKPITIPKYDTFCAHAITQNDIMIVEDATKDERFITNPYVVGEGYRFYAGIPIKISNNIKIGNFCIMGFEPRKLSQKEAVMMREIAAQVESLFRLHQISYLQEIQSKKLKKSIQLNNNAKILIANMHDGLAIQDLEGNLTFVNPSACRILGYSENELLQKSSKDDWSAIDENGNRITWLQHPSMRALHENKPVTGAVIAVKKPDGCLAWLQISAVPLLNEVTNLPEKVLVTFVDISQTKSQEEKLRELSDKAEIANRAKSAFLANMSHEIRTPLNGVLGIATALANTNLDDKQREMVSIINESGLSLSGLLNDIIDLSKIESGNLDLEKETCSPLTILKQSISLFEQSAKQKHIKLVLLDNLPDNLHLVFDKNRVRQIINNLIGNAIKFTNSGSVVVNTHFTPTNDAKIGKLRIEVIDTGLGFDEATKSQLFGRFVQADESISRKFGGSGLGLSICKSLINLMNGKIDCNSKPNVGSCFWFELDLEIREVQENNIIEIKEYKKPNNNQKILIVEDNIINQKVLKLLLGTHDLELEIANNGAIAVDLFKEQKFDLILMDTQMPVMDGIIATKLIREIEKQKNLQRTPIINLSANIMPEQIKASMDAGADDYIAKPIVSDELFEKLDYWLNIKNAA